MKSTLDSLIDTLVHTQAGAAGSARQTYLLRESLHALVRLAQAEQLLDIRRTVQQLVQPVRRANDVLTQAETGASACEFATPQACRKTLASRAKTSLRRP